MKISHQFKNIPPLPRVCSNPPLRLALVSVAEDRTLVEYDLSEATPETGFKLRGEPTKIEQVAVPTACMWHPLLGGDFEDRVVTANNEFKFKQWNADNKSCRR